MKSPPISLFSSDFRTNNVGVAQSLVFLLRFFFDMNDLYDYKMHSYFQEVRKTPWISEQELYLGAVKFIRSLSSLLQAWSYSNKKTIEKYY